MRKVVITAALLCSIAAYPAVRAEDANTLTSASDKIAFSLEGDFYSRYIWRGQVISNGAVFQPSVSANYKGFTATVWSDMDMTSYRNESGQFAEFDLSLDYTNKISKDSKISYSLGVIHYHFPKFSATDTTELYWGFSFDVPLNPTFKFYHGLGNEHGTYANFSIGHTYEKVLKFTEKCYADLQWGIAIGAGNGPYNSDYWHVGGTRLNDLAFTLGLPITFPGGWVVKPNISYITLVDGAIRSSDTYARSSDYLVTGINIIKTF